MCKRLLQRQEILSKSELVEIYTLVAKILHFEEDYEGALKYYEKAIEISPLLMDVKFGLGQIYYLRGIY